jgi:prolyl 4-hydroxylase
VARAAQHCRPLESDRLFWLDGFLRPTQCEAILGELEFAFWERSKVYREGTDGCYEYVYSDKRISATTSERWFSAPLRRMVARIDRHISKTVPEILSCREEWQATKYRKGGRFGYHFDSGYFADEAAGERTYTLLIYLDTPRRGGATRFPHFDIDVKSVAGRLVVWRNLTDDGQRDPEMLHASIPVLDGRKTTLVTWIRQRERSAATVKAKGKP